jgi:hypothetical protein
VRRAPTWPCPALLDSPPLGKIAWAALVFLPPLFLTKSESAFFFFGGLFVSMFALKLEGC